jgi:hypothetical protein
VEPKDYAAGTKLAKAGIEGGAEMNKEFTQRMARAASIRAAKVSKRPLSVWPGDAEVLHLDDLPSVSKEYVEAHRPTGTVTVRKGEGVDFEVGASYGVLVQIFSVDLGLVTTVGVWR